jgi:hypothetical protein
LRIAISSRPWLIGIALGAIFLAASFPGFIIGFETIFAFFIMMRNVPVALHDYEVFDSVITPDAIDMMYNFTGLKIATKMLLHYKAVFWHISAALSKWVIWFQNEFITISIIIALFRNILSGSRSLLTIPMTRIIQRSRHLTVKQAQSASAFTQWARSLAPLNARIVASNVYRCLADYFLTATAQAELILRHLAPPSYDMSILYIECRS